MVELTQSVVDLSQLIRSVQTDHDGALVSFLGVVRDHAEGRRVVRLEYHAYEPMALKVMQEIATETETRWEARVALIHRLGTLEIGETSVAIAVASPHRAEAFAACRHVIERVKADVPIWKREHFEDVVVWVGQPE